MDYTDKFTVIGRNEEGYIVTVVNVVGANYGEVEKTAIETAKKTHLKYEIIHDNTLFDVVYHFENNSQITLENIRSLYNYTFSLNKVVINDDEETTNEEETNSEETTEVEKVDE